MPERVEAGHVRWQSDCHFCVDEQGVILDDRSEAVRPWVGRHCGELPRWVQVVVGVDPLVVLGYKGLDDDSVAGGREPSSTPPS
jgi:hypothetical protein